MNNAQQNQNGGLRSRKRKRPQNPLLPRRPIKPCTGYAMFLRNYFSTHPTPEGGNTREMLSQAAQQWRGLNNEQKQHYKELCREDVERYRNEMGFWKEQKAALKRPCSAYAIYVKDYYARAKAANEALQGHITDIGQTIKAQWVALPRDAKNVYVRRYRQSLLEYRARIIGLEAGTINLDDLANGDRDQEQAMVRDFQNAGGGRIWQLDDDDDNDLDIDDDEDDGGEDDDEDGDGNEDDED